MTHKNLEVLNNTEYEVEVTRDHAGDYEVSLFKPANTDDPYVSLELVDQFFLDKAADYRQLNSRVARAIEADKPSLVGKYAREMN